ncbi:MAG: hypothetical protein LCH91_26435 [Bacteroidetes bacterium]|nr:hypothetical protein [Bacteroidota bacterium]
MKPNISYTALFCAHFLLPLDIGTKFDYTSEVNPNIDGFSPKYMDTNLTVTSSYISKLNSNYISELRQNKKKIESFKQLPKNWNMAGALQYDKNFIDNVELLLVNTAIQPKIFPTGRNSIQFEYEKDNGDYLEFEIFNNSKISYLSIVNDKETSGKIDFDSELMNNLLIQFYA